jgi:hypothetical protein
VEIPSIPSEEPDTDPSETEVYDIRLSVTDVYPFVHFFPDAPAGYGIATPLEVAVTNTGNRPTGILSVHLSGPDKECFSLFPESVDEDGEDFFTVRPKENLEARTEPYTATVTVSGGHGIEKSFGVSFRVTPASAIIPVTGQLSFSLAMALGDVQIFEALVSPDSAVEWSAVHNPSPDVFPTPGVHVVEIVSDDAAGERPRTASGRAAAYAQEPVSARRVRVTATALGTAEITVKTPDGEIFAKCLVAVNPAKEPPEPVIVERGGGGCRGAGAPGLVMGLAIFALTLAARRADAAAGATRTDAQCASPRKTTAGHP